MMDYYPKHGIFKNWVFTLNNPQEDSETLMNLLSPLSGYCIFQKEQGSNGTQHYQGYIQFTVRKRLTAAKSILPRAHWEVARGSPQQCKDYCSKEETRLDGPYETGHMTVQGQRRDIEDFRDSILEGKCDLDLLEEHCKQVAQFPVLFRLSELRLASREMRNRLSAVSLELQEAERPEQQPNFQAWMPRTSSPVLIPEGRSGGMGTTQPHTCPWCWMISTDGSPGPTSCNCWTDTHFPSR